MNCDSGEHRFRPFKRSRDLFCTSCGKVVPVVVERHQSAPALPAPARDEPQTRDPYRDQAEALVLEAAFERQVEKILNDVGAAGPIREKLRAEAISFGQTLDLDVFANYARENVDALRVEEPLENLIDEFGGQ